MDGLEKKKKGPGRPPKAVKLLSDSGIDIDGIEEKYALKREQGSKLTPELLVRLLDAGTRGESISEFCAKNGLSRKSFYKYLEDETFAEAFEHYKMHVQAYYTRLARLSALEGTGVSASGLQVALKFALGFGLRDVHTLATGETIDALKAIAPPQNGPTNITIDLTGLMLNKREGLTLDNADVDKPALEKPRIIDAD
jgi:AcrR family transcriptional regulator